MKIFYSWQSDTDSKLNRNFIREALESAIAGLELEDADRPEIDQDTKGVLGSPVIADTIFQKIRKATIVVADVTLTGQTPNGKRLCNSNVAIELGYALGIHGDQILLKVMNTHFGPPHDLPFDLAHRRWPVQYNLSPDSGTGERKRVRDTLASELREIITAYIRTNRPPPDVFSPTPATYEPAAYWERSEKLATATVATGDSAELRYPAGQPLIYLRIWPQEKIQPLTNQTLNDYQRSGIEPLCGTPEGWSHARNRFGTMTYAYSRTNGLLLASTQVLKTGEIWGVNHHLLRERNRDQYAKFVPTGAFEIGLRNSLTRYLSVARAYFGYSTKIMMESGLINVTDYSLAMPNHYFDRFWGPLFEDVRITAEISMDKPETITQALLRMFEAVFDAAGSQRPENYENFPEKSAT